MFERSHLLFMFYHASSSDTKTHAFSFSFFPLANHKGVAMHDGVYRLHAYKPSKELEVSGVVPVRQYLYCVPRSVCTLFFFFFFFFVFLLVFDRAPQYPHCVPLQRGWRRRGHGPSSGPRAFGCA